jgi:hypothetical protein
MPETIETHTEKGVSLARGPALILGTILLAAGLYFLYKQHVFPKFANFPNGKAPVQGKVFLGIFGANGWTGMLIAIAGGLLLFGAAQHLLAKTMSLIVGTALAAAAIIALASGNVLGLAAANRWTELAWGVVAAILLFNTVIPRRRRTVYATGYAGGGAWRRRRSAAPAAGSDAAATEQDPVANGQGRQDTRLPRGDSAGASAVAGDLAPTRTNQSVASDRNVPPSTEPNAAGPEDSMVRHDPEP